MFCEQNISATCETSRKKASAAIALTYEYLLVDVKYLASLYLCTCANKLSLVLYIF